MQCSVYDQETNHVRLEFRVEGKLSSLDLWAYFRRPMWIIFALVCTNNFSDIISIFFIDNSISTSIVQIINSGPLPFQEFKPIEMSCFFHIPTLYNVLLCSKGHETFWLRKQTFSACLKLDGGGDRIIELFFCFLLFFLF